MARVRYIPMTRFSSDVMDPIHFGIQNFLIIHFVNYTTLNKRESTYAVKKFQKKKFKIISFNLHQEFELMTTFSRTEDNFP